MTPKPLQQGCWPDGTSGAKWIPICLRCGGILGVFGYGPDASGCTCNRSHAKMGLTVPVLPVELVEGLVEAAEVAEGAIAEWEFCSKRNGPFAAAKEMNVIRSADGLREALASYRQALGEGQ